MAHLMVSGGAPMCQKRISLAKFSEKNPELLQISHFLDEKGFCNKIGVL